MLRNPRFVAAALVALAALAGIVVLGLGLVDRRDDGRDARFVTTAPAAAPFGAFAQTRVALDDRCLPVLVADTEARRVQGLRDVRDLGPYAGMLFVFPSDTRARFTMAETPTALDIAWYAADGSPVDHTTMVPCPEGDDRTCPVYESAGPYRYALERVAGSGGASGPLGPCG